MTGKATILFKKITAFFLLLVLFAVTTIQVSHSHLPVKTFTAHQKSLFKKSVLPEYKNAGAESKCFICEYQLTRDADARYFVASVNASVQYHTTTYTSYYCIPQKVYYSFVNRGPPTQA